MKEKIFSVHDSKASAYLPMFICRTSAEAIRKFQMTVQDTSTQFNKFPSDFNLVELGEWDMTSASIKTLEKPLILSNASEFIQ